MLHCDHLTGCCFSFSGSEIFCPSQTHSCCAEAQRTKNTHTHTQMRCSGKYVLWFLLAMVGAQSRGAQRRVFISIMHHFLSNTHPHIHTHTEWLQLFRSSLPVCVLACLCVHVQSETPVAVLKCKCMLEMTNLQQICFTWHRARPSQPLACVSVA